MRQASKLALLAALLLPACVGPFAGPRTATVAGHVRRLPDPATARIELYRWDDGVPVRLPGADVTPRPDGSFRTERLAPARYLLALRVADRPVSVVEALVPPGPAVDLVARDVVGRATLEIDALPGATGEQRLLLTRPEEGVPLVDRREVVVRRDATSRVRGLVPGRWRLDVVGTGATCEIDVPARETTIVLASAPPPLGSGCDVHGRVLRTDGSPAPGVAVTFRPLAADESSAVAWGRYALTDFDGGYHVVGVPAGPVLVRLESRDAAVPHLPVPERLTIPPSGSLVRSFVVGP